MQSTRKYLCAGLGLLLGLYAVGVSLLATDSYRRESCPIIWKNFPEESQFLESAELDAIERAMIAATQKQGD